ncbi:subtilisin-like protease SBT1.8 [Jatropha curcas]|uniref:subtilisin-like protease SBT1.8 n=1 Tax=Jatropha curcas TaxID=180498 RepID=UPI0005FAFB8F|nr:subtilisin-like protease SBT1.8 [Jatropha curcas]
MANIWFFTLLLLYLSTLSSLRSTTTSKRIYILHMNHNSKPDTYTTHHQWYQSLTSTSDSILYTYTTAFQGFAAYLDPEEAESLKKLDNVLNVFEDGVYSLQTTHTPQFLGLNSNFGLIDDGRRTFQEIERASQDIIIGVLDSGIWPESKSFDDTGLPEIPKHWKGKCKTTRDFNSKLCNKKIIGAYYYSEGSKKSSHKFKDIESPRDYKGHGTHTASTAAGSPVVNASMFGYAKGTARGIAANARISSYKVCWSTGCSGADILAGIDRAITDGVDVLSLSINIQSLNTTLYYLHPIAFATFTATRLGIFVSCAAGNAGPAKASVSNTAPWVLTVGAGSIDRNFPAYAFLGNKQLFTGVSLYTGKRMGNKPMGLVYQNGKNSSSNFCLRNTLNPELVRGKVVICDIGIVLEAEKGLAVREAGGVGMIMVEVAVKVLESENEFVPTVVVGKKAGALIKKYVKTNSNPTVVLGFRGTVVNPATPSPMVGSFSSRGPNPVTPQILKPDIIAPGVNILAAWPKTASPSSLKEDNRISEYVIESGTSMACPHATGVAALLKAAHPKWSASAIKSALMTTAYTIDNTNSVIRDSATGSSSNPWAYGSGHIDSRKAFSPGLIYDISKKEYTKFLCSLDYPLEFIRTITLNPKVSCSSRFDDLGELNYPSFSVLFGNKTMVQYSRKLTNAGAANSAYEVIVAAPPAVTVTVKPRNLVFKNVGEKHKYRVTFMAKKNRKPGSGAAFGSITWRNAQHTVSSPIAFTWT